MSRYGIPKSIPKKYARAAVAAFCIIPGYLGAGDYAGMAWMNILIAIRRLGMTLRYFLTFGRFPNYLNPTAMSEKMQWRKAFDRNPVLPTLCDKLEVRTYTSARAPQLRFPKVYWSGNKPEQMPLEEIPLPYVVKANNRSSANIFVLRPEDIDPPRIIQQCREWLSAKPYGRNFGEWAYSQVESKILIEKFLTNGADLTPPPFYELFVFNGRVACIYYSSGGFTARANERSLYTTDWEIIPVNRWGSRGFRPLDATPPKPHNLDFMIEAAEKITAEVDFARVDYYNLDGILYLGEVTPYPSSGLTMFVPDGADMSGLPPREMDDHFGALWALPSIPYWTRIRRGLVG
jgi:hypothetical protein